MNLRPGPLGILGGTFDPIHQGHIDLAYEALALGLEHIAFVPSSIPPHRNLPHASAEQRAQMIQLAIQAEARFSLDTREHQRAGPSYMIDTLREFRASEGPERPLCLLMGSDIVPQLKQWRDWLALTEVAHVIIFQRKDYGLALPPEWAPKQSKQLPALWKQPQGLLYTHACLIQPCSSTQVREAFETPQAAQTLSTLLPPPVLDYIQWRGLYSA